MRNLKFVVSWLLTSCILVILGTFVLLVSHQAKILNTFFVWHGFYPAFISILISFSLILLLMILCTLWKRIREDILSNVIHQISLCSYSVLFLIGTITAVPEEYVYRGIIGAIIHGNFVMKDIVMSLIFAFSHVQPIVQRRYVYFVWIVFVSTVISSTYLIMHDLAAVMILHASYNILETAISMCIHRYLRGSFVQGAERESVAD
ncbi:CPBP family intramembrane glutamic endopeptidase [Alicyclobacillus fructus]|uniref:CPBP family intramembrane glutamic endopeptidase n=1 Tax=Alicyclobacillus fructus TaxID=2816082 RepID=UPI0038B23155